MKPIIVTVSVTSIEQDSLTLLMEIDIHDEQWASRDVTLKYADWVSVDIENELRQKVIIGRCSVELDR